MNVAARLEQAAGAGEVLLGEPTFRLVKDAVRVEAVEPLEMKGKSDRVAAHRLLEVLPDTAGHVRNLDAPMVGRDKELEILRQALSRVEDERTSHLFTLLGPAGVGKSRLVREFLAKCRGRAHPARGDASPTARASRTTRSPSSCGTLPDCPRAPTPRWPAGRSRR